jgi:hypothetical protein
MFGRDLPKGFSYFSVHLKGYFSKNAGFIFMICCLFKDHLAGEKEFIGDIFLYFAIVILLIVSEEQKHNFDCFPIFWIFLFVILYFLDP